MYIGSWKIDDLLTFAVNTHDPNAEGNPAKDADAVPDYRVYEDETGTAIVTGSMAKLDDTNTTGYYSEQITLSAANGFEKGKSYNVYISATVDGFVGTTNRTFQLEAEVDANVVSGGVDVTSISGDTTAANNLEQAFDDAAGTVPWMGIIDQGTAQSATATTVVLRSASGWADDAINGCVIHVYGSTQGYWQVKTISDYVLSTDTVTVSTFTTTPTGTITYRIFGVPLAEGVAQTADHTANIAAILVDTGTTLDGRIPAALVSGRMDASVGAMAANTFTASAVATDAVDEFWDDTIGDGTLTARQALRVLIAALAGKLSGAATTTITIRNAADSANVIVATVDADGNRSAVTVTP